MKFRAGAPDVLSHRGFSRRCCGTHLLSDSLLQNTDRSLPSSLKCPADPFHFSNVTYFPILKPAAWQRELRAQATDTGLGSTGVRSRITSRCISISRVSVGEQEPFSELILVSDRCFIQCRVKMASGSVWRVWIVWLSLSVTLSLGCERLHLLQVLNAETLSKLDEMGGRLPRQCVTERLSLKTKPLDLVKLSAGVHAQDRIQIVHQTLHHIRRIYSRNLSSVTWAQGRVEHFRLLLDRQLRELEDCVRKASTESRPRKNATILKYFRKLTEFLKQKGFSDCAWEITRAETRAHLQQLLLIMAKVSRNH